MPRLPQLDNAVRYGGRPALAAPDGDWTYAALLAASGDLASALGPREGERVAFMVEPGGGYAATLWAIWRGGGIAVPLAVAHPPAELAHVLDDSGAATVVVDAVHADTIEPLAAARGLSVIRAPARPPTSSPDDDSGPAIEGDRPALILYTSGTTGRPKGAVHTHRGIQAQVRMLVEAWGWTEADHTLLVLPLHHTHGLINVLTCALWCGARCDVLPRFDAEAVWSRIEAGTMTVFMAVPTIYSRLIRAWEEADETRRARMSAGCRAMRLMVSGSAALPVPTLERWQRISGHVLLERYGMTEIGMALSNPLDGERRPGHVGMPLPGVEVRLVDDAGDIVASGAPGEIEVRGPAVFREYWKRPGETRAAFHEGWFRTGDLAVVEEGAYRILGRRSVDILKTGGYKVSALEIEDVLRAHPAVEDCAVVGLPDVEWGERIAAAVVAPADTDGEALRMWVRERLAPYKVPALVVPVHALPRNAMGKVTKPAVRTLLEAAAGR